MKAVKIILAVLVVVLIGIQFLPHKLPPNKPEDGREISKTGLVNADVQEILSTSCYDCHSNITRFPWYAKMAPSAWILANHIKEGRDHLNFSEWTDYSKRKRVGMLEDIQEEVESGGMPLKSYILIHRGARMTPDKVAKIDAWIDQATEEIMK
jgi:hypothetical protein